MYPAEVLGVFGRVAARLGSSVDRNVTGQPWAEPAGELLAEQAL
jgi:hypothetical protein